eukprot:TRINITY_DN35368_c0_g1_i1.p1 TRINITY_DN35368_c0_g1~~TRINITY_DN35368_c0_g1_i1.p1  ORF type:complete len:345 (+),score=73.87 TRINITY_DN35368_c0_g1_i1:1-1035(+)
MTSVVRRGSGTKGKKHTSPFDESFHRFREWVALQRVDSGLGDDEVWKYYDFGPKNVAPLVCLAGASGTAEVFHKQFLSLCPKGYRVIAIQQPAVWTHNEWVHSLDRFFDTLSLPTVHLFGASLGGFLAQLYAQYRPSRVGSLVLCNTFCSTRYFRSNSFATSLVSWMPSFLLKRTILANFPQGPLDPEIADAIDFVVLQLETMEQEELASRLTLNCELGEIQAAPVDPNYVTIIDTMDWCTVPQSLREDLCGKYRGARVGHLKTGGDFPYLCQAEQVNLYLQVHLRGVGLNVEDLPPSPLSHAEAEGGGSTSSTTPGNGKRQGMSGDAVVAVFGEEDAETHGDP